MIGPLPPLEIILAIAVVIFFAIGIHEYAHCKFADMAGDPTPRSYGRVTLDLTKHFEPVGTIMMVVSSLTGFGIGWGKPAPINPSKMRNPRWDAFTATLAGPASNLVQAILFGVVMRIALATNVVSVDGILLSLDRQHTTFLAAFLTFGVLTNLSLMLFNLIPLGPLDGHWIVGYLLPERWQPGWFNFQRTVGGPLLIGVIIISQVARIPILSRIIVPPLFALFTRITGISL